jgi:hypothetical protein
VRDYFFERDPFLGPDFGFFFALSFWSLRPAADADIVASFLLLLAAIAAAAARIRGIGMHR